MTSKISFFKLMKEDLRRRSWLLAMTALVLFIAQPVALMLSLSDRLEDVRNHHMTMQTVVDFYVGKMGFESGETVVVLIMVAIVSAFTGFQYLHSKIKLDFYHSLSVKRMGLFFIQFLSGVLIYVIPAFICMLFALAVGGVNGLLTGSIVILALKAFLIHILYYLVIYGTAIMAVMMTGKIIVAFLALSVFFFYGPVVNLILNGLVYKFFTTAIGGGRGIFDMMASYFSPLTFCLIMEGKLSTGHASVGSKWLCIGILLLLALVITALCLLLYTIRKTEMADHSMAFPKTEGIIKFLLAVPISIAIGFYASAMVSTNSFIWLLAGTVFGSLVSSILIEFIYHMDIREVFRHKLQMILALIVGIGIILVFRFDVVGYDMYLPDKEDISEMAVSYDPVNGSYAYKTEVTENGTSSYYGELYGLEGNAVKNFDPIYEMAQEGVKWVKDESRYEQERIAVRYILKSGRSVYRCYYVPRELVNEKMGLLYNTREFKDVNYPLLRTEDRNARYITLTDWNGGKSLNLTKEQRDKLMETYKEELRNITYQELLDDQQIAILAIEFTQGSDDMTTGMEERYPITDSCVNTLALLKEYDYEVPMEPDAGKMTSITVSATNAEDQMTLEVEFTDKEEIKEILQYLTFSCFLDYNALGSEKETDYYVGIVFDNNMNSLWGSFLKGKIPDLVKERIQNANSEENKGGIVPETVLREDIVVTNP